MRKGSTLYAIQSIRFEELPPLGMVLTVGMANHQWTLAAHEPYIRINGTETTVLVWTSPCADCGELFEARTPSTSINKGLGNRRCILHRKPFKRVKINELR